MEEYSIEKSMRKSLSMSFRNQRLLIKAPFFVTKKMIDNFVKKNQEWIYKRKKQCEQSKIDMSKVDTYKQEAKAYIIPRVYVIAEKFGFDFNNIRITSAATRWGSCSSKRNLNFSYRLILTPKDIIDYVIIHELSHLKHMNHSKQFWNEVESMLPNYKEKEQWLKKNSYLYH